MNVCAVGRSVGRSVIIIFLWLTVIVLKNAKGQNLWFSRITTIKTTGGRGQETGLKSSTFRLTYIYIHERTVTPYDCFAGCLSYGKKVAVRMLERT